MKIENQHHEHDDLGDSSCYSSSFSDDEDSTVDTPESQYSFMSGYSSDSAIAQKQKWSGSRGSSGAKQYDIKTC